jgi:hypothetical protein
MHVYIEYPDVMVLHHARLAVTALTPDDPEWQSFAPAFPNDVSG